MPEPLHPLKNRIRIPVLLHRSRLERVAAALTVVTAAIGLVVAIAVRSGNDSLLLLSLLGLASGVLAWRGQWSGHAIGLLFYGPQLASYYPYHSADVYRLGGALSLAFVAHLPSGVLVVNGFAIAMFIASAALLLRRFTTHTNKS